jgi:ATP-binding cassette subfamily B protein
MSQGGNNNQAIPTPQGMSHTRRLLNLAWRYRRGCIQAILLQVALLVLALFGLQVTGLAIDYVRHRALANQPPPHWPFNLVPPENGSAMHVLILLAVAAVGLALVRACLTYFYNTEIVKLVQGGIVVNLRAEVYDKLQRLSFRFFDANASGTLINRITGDVQSVRLFVDGVVLQTITLLVSLLVYLVYMLRIHPLLTLACLATTPLIWLFSHAFARSVKPAYARDRELVDRMILALAECVQGMPVIKGFAREPQELSKLATANSAVRDQKMGIFWKTSLYVPAVGILGHINVAVLLGYGGWLVIRGDLALGTGLIVFLGLLQRFSGQINTITTITDSIQQSMAAAARVFEILDTPVEVATAPDAESRPHFTGAIAFSGVHFAYKPGEQALTDVSFAVAPGQCVGILGTTGSGKSTLLSLIPRFYDVQGGSVSIDGVDVRRLQLGDLRRQVGLVFQESFLFSNTVAMNIAFGHPGATREGIERAARIAAAHDFITALPQGYDTILGEGGADLSGGQRQRLAIARALLLEPPILLLDDPTAAVDAQTEREIMAAVESAMQGRTTVIVTHRIGVLKRADLILVLHEGRIVQRGTHAQLIRVKGHYRRSARIQNEEENLPPLAPGG